MKTKLDGIDGIFGDLKQSFGYHGLDDRMYGDGYVGKFGHVIEAMQDLKISFIPSMPVALDGPGYGCGEPISLSERALPIDSPAALRNRLRSLVKDDRLCFLSPCMTTRWRPINHDDKTIHACMFIGPDRDGMIYKEVKWYREMKDLESRGLLFGDMKDVVSTRAWLLANEEFIHGQWKNFPELDMGW